MSATSVFCSRSANSASRVADSNRIGRTPVASGSSVAAWATRWAPGSPRRRLTTAKDVSPAALSTLRTPAGNESVVGRGGIDRLLGGCQHHLHRLVHRPLDLRAGGTNVAAPSKRGAQGRGINRTAAAHADLGERVVHILEEDCQLQARDAVER